MFVIVALKPTKGKIKTILKIALLIGLLVYIIPKLLLAANGIVRPPTEQKLKDSPIREAPVKVEYRLTGICSVLQV